MSSGQATPQRGNFAAEARRLDDMLRPAQIPLSPSHTCRRSSRAAAAFAACVTSMAAAVSCAIVAVSRAAATLVLRLPYVRHLYGRRRPLRSVVVLPHHTPTSGPCSDMSSDGLMGSRSVAHGHFMGSTTVGFDGRLPSPVVSELYLVSLLSPLNFETSMESPRLTPRFVAAQSNAQATDPTVTHSSDLEGLI